MNSFDNLYVPDPFSGSVLKPQAIWMVDPWTWPNKRYIGEMGDTWTGDKWPFDESTTAPYMPKVPIDFPNIPRNIKTQEELTNWLNQVHPLEKKNYKWENLPDGGSKFTLELAGRSKESVSVEIKNERWVVVSNKLVPSSAAQIGGTYDIPSPENLQLDAAQLTMEHGLLTIIFPPKKADKKVIKLL